MALLRIFTRQAFEEIAREATHTGVVVAWPFVIAAMTLLAGYLQGGPPIAYLIAAASVAFMSINVGILVLILLIYQLRPLNKLKVASPVIARLYTERQGQTKLRAIKYGLPIENISIYPIEYKVIPIRVSLGASINPHPNRAITGGIIQIGASGVFWEAEVPVTGQMQNRVVDGEMDVRIDYGKVGKLNYHMEKKFRATIRFGRNGDIINHETGDAPPT